MFSWLTRRVRSFGHAIDGLAYLLRHEWNFRIHLAITLVVVVAAAVLGFDRLEWIALLLIIALVLVAEALNTALERLVDLVQPEIHPTARWAKDAGAAAVLLASLMAILIGLLLFVHHLTAGH
jgi:undecaprenol kinase